MKRMLESIGKFLKNTTQYYKSANFPSIDLKTIYNCTGKFQQDFSSINQMTF